MKTTLEIFCNALEKNTIEFCEELIKTFDVGEINKTDKVRGEIPMICAVNSGKNPNSFSEASRKVDLLLKHSAFVNGTNDHDSTALHHAAKNDNLELCKLLISRGANILAKNKDNKTPIHAAIDRNHLLVAVLLFEQLTYRLKLEFASLLDARCNTFLHCLVEKDQNLELTRLILPFCDLEARNRKGQTPLLSSAYHSSKESMELLVKAKASTMVVVTAYDYESYTNNSYGTYYNPSFLYSTILHLSSAVLLESLFMLECDLPALDSSDNDYGYTPLHCAVLANDLNKVIKLIEKGAVMNLKSKEGQTPTHLAAIETHTFKILQLLVSIDVNQILVQDSYGMTPVHWAIIKDLKGAAPFLFFQAHKNGLIDKLLSLKITAEKVNIHRKAQLVKGCNIEDLINLCGQSSIKELINEGERSEENYSQRLNAESAICDDLLSNAQNQLTSKSVLIEKEARLEATEIQAKIYVRGTSKALSNLSHVPAIDTNESTNEPKKNPREKSMEIRGEVKQKKIKADVVFDVQDDEMDHSQKMGM